MHNNMLTFGDKKMSKSLGNIMSLRDFLAKYNPEIYKYMMLSVHYRSLSDFTDQGVQFAVAGLARFYSALNLAAKTITAAQGAQPPVQAAAGLSKGFAQALEQAEKGVVESLNDDFNTSEMFAAMFTVVRAFNAQIRLGAKVTPDALKVALSFRDFILDKGSLLSLFGEEPGAYLVLLDDMLLKQKNLERRAIDQLVEERSAVRLAKDFKRSDELRDQLVAMGISLQDTATGTSWEVAK
jgi:cysteinyl-tRNA synthetase